MLAMTEAEDTNNGTAFTVSASTGSSAVSLWWDTVPSADYYLVKCFTDAAQNNTISFSLDSNITSIEIQQLLPRTDYTCCVSTGVCSDCTEGLVVGGELSSLVVGIIGGIAGFVVATLLLLLINVLVCCCRYLYKRKRAKSRVNRQLASVMRTPSQSYLGANPNASFLRTASHYNAQPSSRDIPSSLAESNKVSTTTSTFTGVRSNTEGPAPGGKAPVYTPVLKDDREDSDVDDMGYLYASALHVSQRVVSCHNPPPPLPRTEEAGEFGMMDDVCLEDTEQYEVMLATANNPAYCYRNAPPASGPAGVPTQIYEQLP